MRLIPGKDLREDAVRIASYLVEARGLSLTDLKRAIALQREQELRFSEALLILRLATPGELEAARGHHQPPPASGLGQIGPELQPYRFPGQPAAQRIGALRAQISLRLGQGEGVKLAVVSANSGDGRSQLAAALAIACAQLEQPTLLIDADLRNPMQQRLFGLGAGEGLVQALRGSSVATPAQIDGLPHLTVLGAGGPAGEALELLSGRPFRALVESFATRYRHIILDTPAAEAGFDGVAAAMACGGALLLSRRDHSRMPACEQLVSQLRASSARLLGGVLR